MLYSRVDMMPLPQLQTRTIVRPAALPYSGPAPVKEHSKVLVVKKGNSDVRRV